MDDSILSDARIVDAFWHRSPIPQAIVDRDGILRYTNDAWFRLLGFAYHELVGKHFKEFTHPADLSADASELQRLLTNREAEGYSLDKRYLSKRGAIVRVELHVSAIRSVSGDVELFAVVVVPLPVDAVAPVVARSPVLGRAIARCFDLISNRPREFLVFALLGLIALGRIPAEPLIEFVKSLFLPK